MKKASAEAGTIDSATTPATKTQNRARHALVAVFMRIIVAVVYSWSVFRSPLSQLHGWSKAETIMPYRYSLILVALGSFIGGRWQDRDGPRVVASVGGALVGVGFLISAFYGNTLGGLIAGYGLCRRGERKDTKTDTFFEHPSLY